jgi:hypothetical protein
VQSDIRAPAAPPLRARFAFQAGKLAATDVISWLRALSLFFLFRFLFCLLFGPVIRCFGARAFPSLFQWLLLYLAHVGAL